MAPTGTFIFIGRQVIYITRRKHSSRKENYLIKTIFQLTFFFFLTENVELYIPSCCCKQFFPAILSAYGNKRCKVFWGDLTAIIENFKLKCKPWATCYLLADKPWGVQSLHNSKANLRRRGADQERRVWVGESGGRELQPGEARQEIQYICSACPCTSCLCGDHSFFVIFFFPLAILGKLSLTLILVLVHPAERSFKCRGNSLLGDKQ